LGAVLVYDISNADSFKNCRYWLENIRSFADENVVIAIVGNKTDVLHVNSNKREVPKETVEKFARENNLIFVGESSALSNQNIKEVMDALLESKSIRNIQLYMCIGIYIVQNDLIKKGKKRQEALKLSEEELMLNNHRCCY
jgi:GTPase SAR1 family protein